MSESILNALMNLFAFVATSNLGAISLKEKEMVRVFLRKQVSGYLVDDYMHLFDNYVDFYKREFKESRAYDESPVFYEQAKKICRHLNRELNRHERLIVFFQLLEFVFHDGKLTSQEDKFTLVIAESFDITREEQHDAKVLIVENDPLKIPYERTYIIEGNQDDLISEEFEGLWVEKNRPRELGVNNRRKHENLQGEFLFLHIESINSFVFRYNGDGKYTKEGNEISPGKLYFFENGDIIKGSDIEPIYYTEIASHFLQDEHKTKIIINGKDVEFRFPGSKNGIQAFNFSEESGQLIGIVGGSGVGKSTLLNVLNGNLKLTRGQITINGYDIRKDRFKLQGMIGYVPQDDLLIEELSVYDNLYYNARLCFGTYSEQEIQDTVNRILVDLDLEDEKHLKVGNPLDKYISGGQRKRLNIGLELMREPSILLVDEPTSGLSSMDSEKVVNLLKEQTIKGKLVIANIHQPSSDIFKMFDKIWVLDRGGYPIYTGNPVDAVVYFKTNSMHANARASECPACGNIDTEIILKIIEARKVDEHGRFIKVRKRMPGEWHELYKKNIESKLQRKEYKQILPRKAFRIPDIDRQFIIFSLRNLKSKLSNSQYILINMFEAPLLALILAFFTRYITDEGYIFSENKNLPQYLFMSIVVALFIGLTVSSEEIIRDRKLLQREAFLNLSWFSYLNSKIVYLFGLTAIQTGLYVLIGNLVLEINDMTLSYWIILFSTAAFANMLGLNISAGLDSIIAIYILIPLLLIPQLLLSGVIVNFDDLNKHLTHEKYVPFIGDLMTSRWAYEAIAVEQFKKNKYQKLFFDVEMEISEASYQIAYEIPYLQQKMENIIRNYPERQADKIKMAKELNLIRHEISEYANLPFIFPFELQDELNFDDFTLETGEETLGYLTYVKLNYNEQSNIAVKRKDSIINQITKNIGFSELVQLKQAYHNERIAHQLLDRNEFIKFIETEKEVIRKKDPVYHLPDNIFGRAQFYAPAKLLNDRYIDTIWFNLLAIWLMTFALYVTLLSNALRNLLGLFRKKIILIN
ncbi:MAG: ATP-binding cassette domain-containing protein [Bacteroidota bacterium]